MTLSLTIVEDCVGREKSQSIEDSTSPEVVKLRRAIAMGKGDWLVFLGSSLWAVGCGIWVFVTSLELLQGRVNPDAPDISLMTIYVHLGITNFMLTGLGVMMCGIALKIRKPSE